MRTYEYKSITEGHKGADTRHDDDPGTSAEGNQQAGSVLDYSVGHPYRDPESVQYHENTGRRYAGGGRDLCRPYQRGTTGDNNDRIELGCSYQLSSPVFTQEQKQEYINQRVEAYGMVRGKLIGSNGICAYDGTDYSDRDYFKRSMQGEVVVSDPVIAKTDGKLSVIISAPVYADGDKNGDIVGVVFVVPDPEFLNDIAAAVSVSKNSECYLLGETGITIAHCDSAIAQEQKSNIELSQTDRSLRGIAKVEQKMMTGATGYGTYMKGGTLTIQAYAPIEGTNGWSVAVNAPLTDFLGSTVVCIVIGVAIGAAALCFSVRRAKKIGQAIGEPVAKCTERLRLLAEGDLHTPAPVIRTQDETQILAEATAALSGNLQKVIGDADYLLGEMSEGNSH